MLNLLIVESDIDNMVLESALMGDGMTILKTTYTPSFLTLVKESRPDAVIFNLETPSEILLDDLFVLNRQFPLPVIVFAKYVNGETIEKAMKANVGAFIVDGLDCRRLKSIIQVGMTRFKHQQSLKNALEEARLQLEDRKQIDRAKAILIKTQHFTEEEAYHTLRKLAMDRNITLGEMARNVIAMAELLK